MWINLHFIDACHISPLKTPKIERNMRLRVLNTESNVLRARGQLGLGTIEGLC